MMYKFIKRNRVIIIMAILIFILGLVMLFMCIWYSKDKFQLNHLHNKYKGLVLFDIDDTLTTGLDNYNVVQYCIDAGWAVGICTAGSIYNMDNLKKYPYNRWMPSNLWNFIHENKNITFNNVMSGVVRGERFNYNTLPVRNYGYWKGYALEQTGKALGITDPKRLILCDDQISYIQGLHYYNPEYGAVCAGENCGGSLTVDSVKKVMNNL